MLFSIIYLHINNSAPTITKRDAITPNTISSISNISISLGPGASIISNIWNVNVSSQRGTDLQIQLGSEWGFNPTYPSTIELYIHGNTSDQTYNNDGEIIFIFNVDDKYFSELMSLESSNNNPYQQCPGINKPLITTNITQLITSSSDRYTRFCTHIDNWQNTGNITYRNPVKWPMFMLIQNDPINNIVTYSWGDNQTPPGPKFNDLTFNSSFAPNQGFNIHISGDNLNENFNIFSIHVTYSYTTTPTPTAQPTVSPTTSEPTTNIPTTAIPTNIPTIYPTIMPTYVPTMYPTTTPTLSTNIPTISPTLAPIYNTTIPLTTTQTTRINTVFQTTTQSSTPTEMQTSLSSIQTQVIEVRDTTNNPILISSLQSTLSMNTDIFADMSHNIVELRLNAVVGYIILACILLFGILCFGVGICFGIAFYKKKLNSNDEPNEFSNKASDIEKQLSNFAQNTNVLNKTDDHHTDEDDHESLYVNDQQVFDAKSVHVHVDANTPTKTTKTKGNHFMIDSASESINIAKQTASGEVDDILAINNVKLQSEHPHVHEKSAHNNSISLKVPMQKYVDNKSSKHKNKLQQQIVQQHILNKRTRNSDPYEYKNSNVSENMSVNYADAHMDEKENRVTKKSTDVRYGNTKTYGVNQPDVFPDDEGVSVQRYNEKSVEYNSLKDIQDNLKNYNNIQTHDDEHYNSDPNEDEDEKNVQNEATLGIEIEMQMQTTQNPNAESNDDAYDDNNKNNNNNKEEVEYFKMMERVMLDQSSVGGDENDDNIGPLPGVNNMNIRYSKSGQHLAAIIMPQQSRLLKRKSASEISSSHYSHKSQKSGKSFVTVIHEQKNNMDDDSDNSDDGLNDPEYEQMQLKIQQNLQIRGNVGH